MNEAWVLILGAIFVGWLLSRRITEAPKPKPQKITEPYHQLELIVTGNKRLDEIFKWQYHWERGEGYVKKKTGRENPIGILEHDFGDGHVVIKTPFDLTCVRSDDKTLQIGDLVSGIIVCGEESK